MRERRVWFGVRRVCWSFKLVMGEVSWPLLTHASIASRSYENPSAAMYGCFINSCTFLIITTRSTNNASYHKLILTVGPVWKWGNPLQPTFHKLGPGLAWPGLLKVTGPMQKKNIHADILIWKFKKQGPITKPRPINSTAPTWQPGESFPWAYHAGLSLVHIPNIQFRTQRFCKMNMYYNFSNIIFGNQIIGGSL